MLETWLFKYTSVDVNEENIKILEEDGFEFYNVKVNWTFEGKLTADDRYHDIRIKEDLWVMAKDDYDAWLTACDVMGDNYSPAGEGAWIDVFDSTELIRVNKYRSYFYGVDHEWE